MERSQEVNQALHNPKNVAFTFLLVLIMIVTMIVDDNTYTGGGYHYSEPGRNCFCLLCHHSHTSQGHLFVIFCTIVEIFIQKAQNALDCIHLGLSPQ